jgi:2-aminoethylphosphonate transport system permease protein
MVARRVVLPMALPGIVAGSILCFLFIMNEFGILLVLGSAKLITLPLAIYSSATIDLDLQAASAQAVIMLIASLSVFTIYRRATRTATRSHARG